MPVVVAVEFAERYWYPDDGGEVWLSGYQLVDPVSGSYLARDAPLLAERGLRVSGVAGTQFPPGGALELRRERNNLTTPTRSPCTPVACTSASSPASWPASSRPSSTPAAP